MLALAVAGEKVAAGEDRCDVEADAVVGGQRGRLEIDVREQRVEIERAGGRGLLGEGVGRVPRAQLTDRAAEAPSLFGVGLGLPASERLGGRAVDLGEGREEAGLV